MLGFDDGVDRRRLYGAAESSAHRAELQQFNGERDLRQWRAQHLRRRVLLEPSQFTHKYSVRPEKKPSVTEHCISATAGIRSFNVGKSTPLVARAGTESKADAVLNASLPLFETRFRGPHSCIIHHIVVRCKQFHSGAEYKLQY